MTTAFRLVLSSLVTASACLLAFAGSAKTLDDAINGSAQAAETTQAEPQSSSSTTESTSDSARASPPEQHSVTNDFPRIEHGQLVNPPPAPVAEPSYTGHTPVPGIDYSLKPVDPKAGAPERTTVAPADLGTPASATSPGTTSPGVSVTIPCCESK